MANNTLIFFIALVLIIFIGIVIILNHYSHDIRAARQHIDSLGSQVIETKCGPVEYARIGEGDPVLVVHGALGGFDQGLFLARSIDIPNSQIISVSRFGFLRSPVPPGATLDTQADAFAALLDALEIREGGGLRRLSRLHLGDPLCRAPPGARLGAHLAWTRCAGRDLYGAAAPLSEQYPVRERFCVLGDDPLFRKEDANRDRPGAQGIRSHPGICGPGQQGPDQAACPSAGGWTAGILKRIPARKNSGRP